MNNLGEILDSIKREVLSLRSQSRFATLWVCELCWRKPISYLMECIIIPPPNRRLPRLNAKAFRLALTMKRIENWKEYIMFGDYTRDCLFLFKSS